MYGIEHMELAALAKRGLRLGYTPDVLNDAGNLNIPVHLKRLF